MAPGTILLEIVLPPLAHRPDLWPQDSLQHLKVDVLVDSLSLIEPVEDDLAINDGGEGEIVEYFCAVSPDRDTPVLPETLVIEPVHLSDLSALVVSSDQINPVGIANFQSQQQKESLDAVKAAVHKVSHEEIICVGNIASNFEQLF